MLKLQHSDWRANLVKDFFLNKFSTNESTRIIIGHVIYNPVYMYKFQLKTTFFNSDGSGFPIFFLGIVGCRPLTNFSGRRTIWWIHNNTCFVQPSIAIFFVCRVGNTDQIMTLFVKSEANRRVFTQAPFGVK